MPQMTAYMTMPVCEDEDLSEAEVQIDVDYTISSHGHPGSYWEPPEGPEIEIDVARMPDGAEFCPILGFCEELVDQACERLHDDIYDYDECRADDRRHGFDQL